MAYEEIQTRISLDADASIAIYTGPPGARGTTAPYSGMQYRFVKITGPHEAGLCTNAAGEIAMGVLQNKPQVLGSAAEVAISGVSRLQCAGAIVAGDPVTNNATGQAIKATGAAVVLGVASLGGAIGELASVLLRMN